MKTNMKSFAQHPLCDKFVCTEITKRVICYSKNYKDCVLYAELDRRSPPVEHLDVNGLHRARESGL